MSALLSETSHHPLLLGCAPATMPRGQLLWLLCAPPHSCVPQNLSAPFIMQVPPFKSVLMATMPAVDYLFGNEV